MVFENKFVTDLQKPLKVQQSGGIVLSGDDLNPVITVELYNGSTAATPSGTVVGAVIRADGLTVPLTGSISGNAASVTLTEDCFAVRGQISVGIQIVDGNVKTTVLKAVYNVEPFDTGNIPSSGDTAASVADLIDEIETATAAIPADYTELQNKVAALDTAMLNVRETGTVNIDQRLNPNQGNYGELQSFSGVNTTDYINVDGLRYILIAPTAGRYAFYDENKTCLSSNTVSNAGVSVGTNLYRVTVGTGAVYYRQSAAAANGAWDNLIICANPIADAFAAMLTPAATLTMGGGEE